MKPENVIKALEEIEKKAGRITIKVSELNDAFNNKRIDAETLRYELETLHRHHSNELVAMLANLEYAVGH